MAKKESTKAENIGLSVYYVIASQINWKKMYIQKKIESF